MTHSAHQMNGGTQWLTFQLRQQSIIWWAAYECERQESGELSVARMIEAWNLAMVDGAATQWHLTEDLLLDIAQTVEHRNVKGYRTTPVTFANGGQALSWELIERQVHLLIENQLNLTPIAFTKRLLEVHCWEDGNGRTAAIVYNYLNGSLESPLPLPKFDFDWR